MALQGGLLDQPAVASDAAEYPPEVIARMKQMGIWHPGTVFPMGSRRGREEADILGNILSQYQRSQELGESRAQRKDIAEANLGQRKLYQEGLTESRAERTDIAREQGAARKAQMLQYVLNDPTMAKIYGKSTPQVQKAIADQILSGLDITPPAGAGPGVTTTKGEFGPGGAPAAVTPPAGAPPPTSPADVYSGTPLSTAGGGGGTPEAPRPLNRYFQPAHFAGLNPSQIARAASNLDVAQAADEYANMLQYKSDIGAPAFERIYGTSDPSLIRSGMPPAAAIPQIYGGRSTIPESGPVGYYGSKGEFLGPMYTETGEKLPMPKGATGIRGTAGIAGLQRGAGGELTGPIPDYLKPIVAGMAPTGRANVPTTEAMTPTPAPNVYRPDTGTFAPTGGEIGAGAAPAPTPAPIPGAAPPPEAWAAPAVGATLGRNIATLFGAGQQPPFPRRVPGRIMY